MARFGAGRGVDLPTDKRFNRVKLTPRSLSALYFRIDARELCVAVADA